MENKGKREGGGEGGGWGGDRQVNAQALSKLPFSDLPFGFSPIFELCKKKGTYLKTWAWYPLHCKFTNSFHHTSFPNTLCVRKRRFMLNFLKVFLLFSREKRTDLGTQGTNSFFETPFPDTRMVGGGPWAQRQGGGRESASGDRYVDLHLECTHAVVIHVT